MPKINVTGLDTCLSFKALGILLCYPTAEWQAGIGELPSLLKKEGLLNRMDVEKIELLIEQFEGVDLLELQEAYVNIFDRTPSLSLHLFEHVHGQSRDRGQAMVDLSNLYAEHGMDLAAKELPDYLPVFLEFLSVVEKSEAMEILTDPLYVIAAIGKRLGERLSPYRVIFDGLLRIVGQEPEIISKREDPKPIDYALLDKDWEDKQIEFLGASTPESCNSCGSQAATPKERSMIIYPVKREKGSP